MTIKLNTIEDVNRFVNICIRYAPSDIDIKQNRQVIKGTSILWIFSLNLLKPLKVVFVDKNDNKKNLFYNNIKKWEIKKG